MDECGKVCWTKRDDDLFCCSYPRFARTNVTLVTLCATLIAPLDMIFLMGHNLDLSNKEGVGALSIKNVDESLPSQQKSGRKIRPEDVASVLHAFVNTKMS